MSNNFKDASYTKEKLNTLLYHFASSDCSLKERFRTGLNLVMTRIEIDDFPDEHRDMAASVIKAFTDYDSMSVRDLQIVVDHIGCLRSAAGYYLEDLKVEAARAKKL